MRLRLLPAQLHRIRYRHPRPPLVTFHLVQLDLLSVAMVGLRIIRRGMRFPVYALSPVVQMAFQLVSCALVALARIRVVWG